MLIKQADDKTKDIETLKALSARSDVSPDLRKRIDAEIRNIQSGIKGESEAAYEIEFYYGTSKNWMSLHDLRLECDGRVAQIDHLLINRFLDIYVCESKRFSEGVGINEEGEFAAFYGSKPYGVPSPIEQNNRHMKVLESVFKTGLVSPPKRLGFTITPSLSGLVLVSKNARISRPKKKLDGIETVIKNDQLKARVDKDFDSDNNPLTVARIISQETLQDFATRLAAVHRPIRFDWAAKFGLPAQAPIFEVAPIPAPEPSDEGSSTTAEKKSKLACVACGTIVAYNVAKFCWFNKPRFEGNVYCMDCQKNVPKPA